MSKYIDADKLIAEIEQELSAHNKVDHLDAQEVGKAWSRGHRRALEEMLDFITSLQQEQSELPGIEEPGIPGKDFIPVDWVETCERYGKWMIVKPRQPEVDLEKAARYVYESWMGGTMNDVRRDMVELGKVLNAIGK